MNRRHAQAVTILSALAISGCAMSRMDMPGQPTEPVSLGQTPPIHESINVGLARRDSARAFPNDPEVQRASAPRAPSRTLPTPRGTPVATSLATDLAPSDPRIASASLAPAPKAEAKPEPPIPSEPESPPVPEPVANLEPPPIPEPAAEVEPVAEESVALKPEPAAEEPVAPEPESEEPAAPELEPKPTAEEPAVPDQATEDPVAPALAAEEPVAPEQATEEPVAPEQATEEPVAPEQAAEEPVAPELAAAEPVAPEAVTGPGLVPALEIAPDPGEPRVANPPSSLPDLEPPPPLPDLEPPPLDAPESTVEPTPEPVTSAEPPRDPAVTRTAHVAEDALMSHRESPGRPATRIAARVGDTVITLHELEKAVKDRVRSQQAQAQQGQGRPPQPSRDQINQIARESLEYLIDRAMMVQAARRELTKPKQWEMFEQFVTKRWEEEELPSMMKRVGVHNSYELEQALAERGDSLAERREEFKLNTMAREFAGMKLHGKVSEPTLPEVYAYYRQNLHNYDQAAQVTWREIFLPIDAENDRETAQRVANDLLQRLSRGEDFATLARQFSKSPKADEGGLWQTGFNSFGSTAVNQALAQLKPGQFSPILEDPRGLYLVRVESIRPAGPKTFQEVQQSIKLALMSSHSEHAMDDFLKELYRSIPVSSPLFEGTETEPKQIRLGRELLAGGRSAVASH